MPSATPDGVPVAMMSPGSRVMPAEMWAISSGTPVIICAQLASWRTSPLTSVRSVISPMGGAAAASSTTGPSGANVQRLAPDPLRLGTLQVPRGHVVDDRVTADLR